MIVPMTSLDELSSVTAGPACTSTALAFLPVGSVEAHGPSLPLGTDSFIALAFSHRLSRKTGGVALPLVPYGYCGTTAELGLTVSVDILAVATYLEHVCRAVIRTGLSRLVLLSIHEGNAPAITIAIRRVFDDIGIPILFVNPYVCFAPDLDRLIFGGMDNHTKEAALLHAALNTLGLGEITVRLPVWDDEQSQRLPELTRLRSIGTVGYAYSHEPDHIAARRNVPHEAGEQYMNEVVNKLVPYLQDYERYWQAVVRGGQA